MKAVEQQVTARVVRTGAGWVGWSESPDGLRRVTLPRGDWEQVAAELGTAELSQADPAESQLAARLVDFYAGEEVDFSDVPLALPGETAFQAAVRQVVRGIPRGRTMSYGEVAEAAGRPGAGRAVGQVMARNPVPPIIPCHRVLATGGGLGGFGGGLRLKADLLRQESAR